VARSAGRPTRDIDFTPGVATKLNRLSAVLDDLDTGVRTEGVPEGRPLSHTASHSAAPAYEIPDANLGDFDLSLRPSGTDGYDGLVPQSYSFERQRPTPQRRRPV
jgi:hypothetical protein